MFFSVHFHIGYVGKVNVFFAITLDISFDGNMPTFYNHSPVWAEIEGNLLRVRFSERCVILSNYTHHVC